MITVAAHSRCAESQTLQKSREGMLEQESLEATSENRHRGYKRDMLGQTPSTGSSNSHATGKGRPCHYSIYTSEIILIKNVASPLDV